MIEIEIVEKDEKGEEVSIKYLIERPCGKAGAMHMKYVSRMPSSEVPLEDMRKQDIGEMQEDLSNVFFDWCDHVLPLLKIEGPFTSKNMPGEHQFVIFTKLMEYSGENLVSFR